MSIITIDGFDIKKSVPADVKEVVANQAARLAIVYPYTGLCVLELDTQKVYRYKTTTPVNGSVPTNLAGDWERKIQIYTGSGIPSNTLGANDDIYIEEAGTSIYKKIAAAWVALFSMTGSQLLYGAGVPSGGSGSNNDSYINISNGDMYKKAGGVWSLQLNIKGANGADGDSDLYATTSATSINLATAVAPLSLTVATGLNYSTGQAVIVASRANNANNLTGTVVSYTTGTGVLILNSLTINGTGTLTDWDVNLTGVPGTTGKGFIHTESDINLSDAKVATVVAGGYTPQNPYLASVANDTRALKTVPAALIGGGIGVAGHSIAYNGTTWFDNGQWLGPKGATGATGPAGTNGTNGTNGINGIIEFQEGLPIDAILGGGVLRYGVQNLPKKWYHIDLLTTQQLVFRNGSELGTIVTITRTTLTLDGAVPSDSLFTAAITANIGEASLNYKGRYVTSIPVSSRNITFVLTAKVGGIDYWNTVGEDSTALVDAITPNTSSPVNMNFGGYVANPYSYPVFSVVGKKTTIPKIEYNFGVFRDTNNDLTINAYIYASHSNFVSDSVIIKQITIYLQRVTPTYITISAIDPDTVEGSLKYYKLVLAGSITFRTSIQADRTIYSVLKY